MPHLDTRVCVRFCPWILIAIGLLFANLAQAGHVNTTPYVEARGDASAGDGFVNGSALSIWIYNGALVGTPLVSLGGDGTASWSAGPMVPGISRVFVLTEGTAAGTSYGTLSSADKRRGELKAAVVTNEVSMFVSASASAQSRFKDALWFTNSTGAALPVVLRLRVDGLIEGIADGRAEVFSLIELNAPGAGCNAQGQCITPNPNGSGAASGQIYGLIDQRAGSFNFRSGPSGPFNDDIPWWTFTLHPGHAPTAGSYEYSKGITLWVPTGQTTLFVDAWLNIQVCSRTRNCDFSNTSALRFDPLPPGLSMASQSGELLNPELFRDGFE